MRNRIDKLGVASPIVTKQGANQIVIELPAVHNINDAAKVIGKTAVLELYDMTPSLLPPSIDASQNPVPFTSLYTMLARVQSGQKGQPEAAYLFRTKTKKVVAGPVAGPAARAELVKTLLKRFNGKAPKGTEVLTVPPRAIVIECDSTVAVVCPGVAAPGPRRLLLLPLQARRLPTGLGEPVPADDGQGSEAVGDAAGLRSDERPADRDDAVHRPRQQGLPRHHPGRGGARADAWEQQLPELRDRARQPDLLVPDDQLPAVPRRDRPDRRRRPDHRHGVAEGGEEPRSRPPDGRSAGQVRHDRAHRRLGHARQGLAEAGPQRRDRRPDPGRGLPASPLPLPRPRRGDRPRRLLGIHVRRDPDLRRHAHAAGLRRPDPDDRRRRGRERRRVRTHQGRSARREIGEGRDSGAATRRASTRSSTRTWSPASPRSCCSGSRPPR